jgi:hypothetical protein
MLLLVITPAVFVMNRLKHNSHVPSKRTRLRVLLHFEIPPTAVGGLFHTQPKNRDLRSSIESHRLQSVDRSYLAYKEPTL